MRLVVLGSGTSVPHPQRASAAFWLDTTHGSILLDCGGDTPHRMAQEKLDWPNVDAIWISHLHLDHCGGLANFLFGLRWAAQTRERLKPLRIFGCEGIGKLLRAINETKSYKLFEQHFPIELKEVSVDEMQFEFLPGLRTQTFSTPHTRESLALRLTDAANQSLVYTSDTGFAPELAKFSLAADLLIIDCSFWQNKPSPKHLELSEAMQLTAQARPRRALLTHLYPEWDGVDIEAEAKKFWSGEVLAASDGLVVNL